MSAGYIPSLERKKAYVDNLASLEGIDLSMLKWEFKLPTIELNIGWNVVFNFLLNLHLDLNLHFDMPSLDFEMPEFGDFFFDIETGLTFNEIFKVEKARYGISKYGKSIYVPEQVTSLPLRRCLWDLRYKTTEKDDLAWKQSAQTLGRWIAQLRKQLVAKDIADYYIDAMIDTLRVVEGKLLNVSYVGFAVVDACKVSPPASSVIKFKVRDVKDWTTELEFESLGIWDTHVDVARVGYSRVCDKYAGGSIAVKKGLIDNLVKRIEDFRKRSGFVEQYGVKTIYQRTFFYQKKDKMHWEGGEHQLRLQRIKNTIKQLLNNKGIIAQFRAAYLAFTQELYYLTYEPHRKFKKWKKLLTSDELVDKYVMMGLDKSLLLEIKGVIGR